MLSPKASKLAIHVVGKNSTTRSAVPEKPTVEQNTKWIGRIFKVKFLNMNSSAPDKRRACSCTDIINIRLIKIQVLRPTEEAFRHLRSI